MSETNTHAPNIQPEVISLASFNADLIGRVPRPPARGETLMGSGFDTWPGGKGSNAAVACARQGATVAVIARLGDDDFARIALDLWAREGIDASAVECAAGERTGVALIWVYDDGDNSIAVIPGAGAGLTAAHAEAAADRIRAAKLVMAPNEVPSELTLAAFRIARAAGVTTLLNPAPARALPAGLLELVDVLTPNESELAALAPACGLAPDAAPQAIAQALLQRGAGAVVVTQGAAGCTRYRRGSAPLTVRGHRMTNVADTIGAGDTFNGALAAALARGEALDEALRWANAAAALSVTGHGALGGMPRLPATRALMGGCTGG